MKKILEYILPVFAFLMLTVTACYEDQGNYDYSPIDTLKIDTVGFAAKGLADRSLWPIFDLQLGDVISGFELNVTYGNKSTENLEYAWIIYDWPYVQVNQGNEKVWPDADTICRTKSLEWVIDDRYEAWPKFYHLQFVARDPETGVKAYYDFNWGTSFSAAGVIAGLYVLSEYEGDTDIDVIKGGRFLINSGAGSDHAVTRRVYTQLYGAPLPGKPAFIATAGKDYYIFTDRDAVLLNHDTGLQIMQRRENMFFEQPDTWNPQALKSWTSGVLRRIFVNDGKMHVMFPNSSEALPLFSDVVPETSGRDYRLAPFLAAEVYASPAYHLTVVFDASANCYRPYYNAARTTLGAFQSNLNAQLNVANINGRVIRTFNTTNYRLFSLIEREEGGTNKYLLYKLNFRTLQTSVSTDFTEGSYVDMSACPEIANAKYFASNNAGNTILYATDTKVYSVGPNSSSTNPNWFLIHEAGAGEQITCIQQSWSGGFPSGGAVTWIGVWNEGAGEGSLYEYLVDESTGRLSTVADLPTVMFVGYPDLAYPQITTGLGKITEIAFSTMTNM